MSIIQNSHAWYFPSPVTVDNITIMLGDLMASKIYQSTAMERYDARQYGRAPAGFDMLGLKNTMTDILTRLSILTDSAQDIMLLDGLVSWLYRNTDSKVRDALLMVSWFLRGQVTAVVPDGKHAIARQGTVQLDKVYEEFAGESVNFMTNVVRHAVITVPMEARLPMNQCKQTYHELTVLSSVDKQLTQDSQYVDESQRCLRSVNPSMNLIVVTEGPGEREYAIKRLFQTVQVIAMIKSEDNFSMLRAFLANAQSMAMTARIYALDDQLHAADLMMVLASVERSVTAHSFTAAGLIARAEAGQLVYAEMLRLVKEWHSLVNNDLNMAFAVFSNALKVTMEAVARLHPNNETAIVKSIDDMLTRTEIKSTYLTRRARLSSR